MKFNEFKERTDRMSEQEIDELLAGLDEQGGDELVFDFAESGKDFYKKMEEGMEQFKHLLPPKK